MQPKQGLHAVSVKKMFGQAHTWHIPPKAEPVQAW